MANIIYNSEKACNGSVFVCIKGANADGHYYTMQAVSKGACTVVCSEEVSLPPSVTVIKVPDTRKAMADMAAEFYGRPAEKMKVIGVTGTKGKTTTTFMIQSILQQAGYRTGLIGTIHIDTGKEIIESEHTTPESAEVQKYLRAMVDNGCEAAVIEVSSQALKCRRTEAIKFDFGVFTNIEEDHISPLEHIDFADYAGCKAKLFQQCKTGIINNDDPCKDLILENHTCETETYGFNEESGLQGFNYGTVFQPDKLGVKFSIRGDCNMDLAVCIPGKFTCRNAMAAVAVCRHFPKVKKEHIQQALGSISIPGRQEMFSCGKRGIIMVDYAHNGTALRSLLESLREYQPKKLTCLFGCGGERDRMRRIRMGEAASAFSDFTVITSDNPRNEPPMSIIDDIINEMKKHQAEFIVLPDRREAIEYAVKTCEEGEITVIAGKGHENYQITGNKKIHFDDREEVLLSIEKVKHETNYNC